MSGVPGILNANPYNRKTEWEITKYSLCYYFRISAWKSSWQGFIVLWSSLHSNKCFCLIPSSMNFKLKSCTSFTYVVRTLWCLLISDTLRFKRYYCENLTFKTKMKPFFPVSTSVFWCWLWATVYESHSSECKMAVYISDLQSGQRPQRSLFQCTCDLFPGVVQVQQLNMYRCMTQ